MPLIMHNAYFYACYIVRFVLFKPCLVLGVCVWYSLLPIDFCLQRLCIHPIQHGVSIHPYNILLRGRHGVLWHLGMDQVP